MIISILLIKVKRFDFKTWFWNEDTNKANSVLIKEDRKNIEEVDLNGEQSTP